jgi:large subunit ribosomal protein L9
MRLILTQEVTGLGSPGDIVEVKDGYGRNYLVPRGYAMKATRGAEKEVAALRRAREVRDIRDLDQARQLASQLASLPVRLPTRSGAGGRLFGSVTPADIVDAVVVAGGPKLDRRRLQVEPIKTVGSHRVSVRLHPEVEATLNLEVVPAS